MENQEFFDWDENKNKLNFEKHGVAFEEVQFVFEDSDRLIYEDVEHSTTKESRYYCIGKIGEKVCTVRFIFRNNKIRIFGAGYWRKERKLYEKNQNW